MPKTECVSIAYLI